jgi:hypothetical protein
LAVGVLVRQEVLAALQDQLDQTLYFHRLPQTAAVVVVG